MSLPTVVFLVPALLCGLSWLGIGSGVPSRFLPNDRLLEGLTRLAVGSAVVMLVVFSLGRVGALNSYVLLVGTVVLALVGMRTLRRFVRHASLALPAGRALRSLVGLTAAALLLDVVAASAPPTSADALVYHVALPRRWLDVGSIHDLFWNSASFYPLGVETLYAQAMSMVGGASASALAAGATASVTHALLAAAAVAAVFGLGRELAHGDSAVGIVACALFALQGVVTWDATSAFVDMGLTFFVVLAVWHGVRFARSGARIDGFWTGVAAGMACATKYLGPLYIGFLLAMLLLVALARRRLSALGLASVVTVVVASAWYVKNAVVTGNPFYPLFFGGKMWSPYAQHRLDAANAGFPGTHGTPARILLLPFDLLRHGGRFDRGQYASTATLILAPTALLIRANREIVALFVATFGSIFVWWYASPQTRYLLPALAVLAVIAAYAVTPILSRPGWARRIVLAVLGAAALAWLAASIALTRQLLPVTFGGESGPAEVQRLTGTFDALHAVAQRLKGRPVAFVAYRFLYWYPGPAIEAGAPEFTPVMKRRVYLERLHKYRIAFLLQWHQHEDLRPLQGCAVRIGTFQGRFVTSRSRGSSVPLQFDLYSLATCLREAGI